MIAVAASYKSKERHTGEQKALTEWHRISFFGRLAEIVGQYLKKGSSAYVEKYVTDIIAENMQMLGGRQGMGGGNDMDDMRGGYEAPSRPAPNFSDMDDDIAF